MTEYNKKNQTDCTPIENDQNHTCPNCWGKSEYDGKLCDKEIVDKDQKGWIQNYAEKRLF